MTNLLERLFIPLSFHPLFYITVGVILGIGLHTTCPLALFSNSSITSLSIIAAAVLVFQTFGNPRLITPLFSILLGITLGYGRAQYQLQEYHQTPVALYNQNIDVIGTVTDYTSMQHQKIKQCTTLCLTHIKNHDKETWIPIDKKIKIYTVYNPKLQVADVIQLTDICIKKSRNESYESYLIKEGIAGTIFAKKLEDALTYRPQYSIKRWAFNHKIRIFNAIKAKMSPETFAFFSSLFLGNRADCKKEIEQITEQFKDWGILHYLARSGLHLVIFILLWQTVLGYIPLPFTIKQLILLVLGILYFIFTWPSISFIRAFVIFILYKFCNIVKVQSHFLHLLTLVCLFTLIINPIQLMFLDFQLSFALTFALAWLSLTYGASNRLKQKNC